MILAPRAPGAGGLEAARLRLLRGCRERLGPRHAGKVAVCVPGRIEVLGKHTDYGGGRSLLCAVQQGFCAVARPRPDDLLVVTAWPAGERFECRLDGALEPTLGHWSNYPATVARRVARNFPSARVGADLVFASDLPPAAGMSSSSAFMIAVFAVLATVNGLDDTPAFRAAIADPLDLAAYAATIENGRSFRDLSGDRGVGTFGGSEDHTAILCCREGRLAQYAFGPARFESDVALEEPWQFVVASSGVIAEKTGAARDLYNRASRLASDVLAIWNRETGRADASLMAVLTLGPDMRREVVRVIQQRPADEWPTEALVARVEQFALESLELVPDAVRALAARDVEAFGDLVARSQDAAERWLRNQVPETVCLAREARVAGSVAASAFGAGFGGSVWALVPAGDTAAFIDRWRARYQAAHPAAAARATFVATRPGAAAFSLTDLSVLD